ncbi:MAG: hypothetical protein RIM72_18070 [Alphaproteobacteria bacterium]
MALLDEALAPFHVDQDPPNPNTCWDYWIVGGRWDGTIRPRHRPAAEPGSKANNICKVTELPFDSHDADILLPDGTWITFGDHYRWLDLFEGRLSPEVIPRWQEHQRETLKPFAESYVVALDLHS